MPDVPADGDLARGLKNVILDTTETSFIDGEAGKLLYHGYNIHDLAQRSTFEEVIFLLWYGRLPTRSELADLDAQLKANRRLPGPIIDILRLIKQAHPMDALRTAVSALSTFDTDVNDESREAQMRKALRLTAQFPTIVAAHYRIFRGQEPVDPSPSLSHAANFLYMLFGQEPDEDATKAIDVDLILHAEHGANASAFSARVTASTAADFHCDIVAAIATLKGPLHGGAAEAVMRMLEDIGSPDRVEEYIRGMLARGERIMGMGHRVYRVEDPRARHMKERARILGQKLGHPE
ncbi:MAG TPA: citrate/2-methylcitrate synthase, partial [Dehalococcoidia bacterium]|nr:citrate/2-methylcitrate synthase [Dehalococcoidia bacterium]